jgi:hypothetical protein
LKKSFAMLRSLLFLLLLALAPSCRNQFPEDITDILAMPENASRARYDRSALQKMQWLSGIWNGEESGRPVRQSFQFHDDNALEIIRMEGNGDMVSLLFSWQNGRYYYGQNRQWAVTWIGEKDIRFDPLTSGLESMTWTRLNDHQWHLVRHAPEGDETTVMERTNEMQP